jgi:hypothetical protein
MTFKSVAALAFIAGVATGVATTEALTPDNFAALTQMIGEPASTQYRQCLNQKGWGRDLNPLSLREFCGVYVTSKYMPSTRSRRRTPNERREIAVADARH